MRAGQQRQRVNMCSLPVQPVCKVRHAPRIHKCWPVHHRLIDTARYLHQSQITAPGPVVLQQVFAAQDSSAPCGQYTNEVFFPGTQYIPVAFPAHTLCLQTPTTRSQISLGTNSWGDCFCTYDGDGGPGGDGPGGEGGAGPGRVAFPWPPRPSAIRFISV